MMKAVFRSKWFWGTILSVALLAVVSVRLFQTIHAQEWQEEDIAVNIAYHKTAMVQATKAEPYVGEQPYTIVFGTDKLGQQLIVWVGTDRIHSEYAKDGIPMDELQARWQEDDLGKQLLRVTPAELNGEYGWEMYYKKTEDGKDKFYYDYLRFRDGSLIDTYRLTLGRG
jgi:uncharacterized protein YpmB